jgi:hypothetical protein
MARNMTGAFAMRQNLLFSSASLLFLVVSSGCTTVAYNGRFETAHHHRQSTAYAVEAAADTVGAIVDLAAAVSALPEPGAAEVDDNHPQWAYALMPIPPHEPAAAADSRVEAAPKRFDLSGAYSAVDGVDLSACKADGLAAGYGRVAIGFAATGSPAGLTVDLPDGSTPAARACVEGAFRQVSVAAFDGADVKVTRSFFVKQ